MPGPHGNAVPAAQKRTHRVPVKVNAAERLALDKAARRDGYHLKTSAWLRQLGLARAAGLGIKPKS